MLDEQYIKLAGQRLRNFKVLARNRFRASCPFCGDSAKDKNAARGNFYIFSGSYMYKCFNCGIAHRIPAFLEKLFPDLYDEYVMGYHRSRESTQNPIIDTTPKPIVNDTQKNIVFDLPKLSDLPDEHPAVSYIKARKVPSKYLHDLYFAEKFKAWSNTQAPDTFDNVSYDDSRIVIPFRDESGNIFAFQGRAIGFSKVKYLTVKIDLEKQKIYGLDRINYNEPIYVVEGPIDSWFIDNCLGTADSGLTSIGNVNSNLTFAWDNEPRSKIICSKLQDAVESGKSVVIWPKEATFNDINDAIMEGYTIEEINVMLRKNTFSGLAALVELNNWRKA